MSYWPAAIVPRKEGNVPRESEGHTRIRTGDLRRIGLTLEPLDDGRQGGQETGGGTVTGAEVSASGIWAGFPLSCKPAVSMQWRKLQASCK